MAELTKQALKVENNTEFPNNNNGAIAPSNLRNFNVDMIDSLVDEITYTADSASWNQSIDALEAFTSSQQPSFAALNSFTASQLVINSGVNSFTQSADSRLDTLESEVANIEAFTASVNQIADNGIVQGTSTRLHFSGLVSASIVPNVGGAIASINIEQDGTKLNTASFNAYTASTDSDLDSIHQTTASLNTFSASANVSITNLNASSASQQISIDALNSFSASASGLSTGSLLVTASFDNGTRNLTFTKGDASTFNVNIPDVSGSSGNFVTTSSFNSYTASTDSSISQLNAISASQQISINALNTNSASVNVSIANINTFTQSADISINALNAATSSYITSAQTSSMTVLSASFAISSSHSEFADDATNSLYAQNTITTGKNLHNTTIAKGTPLYFTGSGTAGNLVGVYPADAGNPSRMPAGGIAGESIAVGDEGIVLLDGYIGGVNTTAFASGDEIFVAVGGGYTNVAPTGSALIQHLGNVEKSDINGSGVIQMAGEARGLPNIQTGYAWVGDSNGVPQAVATSSFGGGTIDTASFATTGSNTFSGNQTISGFVSASNGFKVGGSTTALEIGDGSNIRFITGSTNFYNIQLVPGVGDIAFSRDGVSNVKVLTLAGAAGNNTTFQNNPVEFQSSIGGVTFSTPISVNSGINGNVDITGSLKISSTFDAPLTEGFVWVGANNGRTTTVSTSSFGGGGGTISVQDEGTILGNATSFNFNGAGVTATLSAGTASITIPGGGGTIDTGSFLTTGSAALTQTVYGTLGFNAAGTTGTVIELYNTGSDASGSMELGVTDPGNPYIRLKKKLWFQLGPRDEIYYPQFTSSFDNGIYVGSYFSEGKVGLLATSGSLGLFGGNPTANRVLTNIQTTTGLASAAVNLVFANSNTATTILSGSNNIWTNATSATAGFNRYMTTGNIAIGGSGAAVPQISGSMAWSPTISNNVFASAQTPLTWRGPVSASASTFNNNVLAGGIVNLGTAAATHFERATIATTINGNLIAGGAISAVASKTPLSASISINSNMIGGGTNLNMDSSSISLSGNNVQGLLTVNNSYFPNTTTATQHVSSVNGGLFIGTSTIYTSGSNTTFTGAPGRQITNAVMLGASNVISASLNGDLAQVASTSLIGQSLNVIGSNSRAAGLTAADYGSVFVGRWNAIDGTKNLTAETVFAVGTGTGTATRKTGFLIDSGSNTFVEGSLNVSGSTSFTGSATISQTLQLGSLDPLPAGTTGMLAVSQSLLWFYDATQWRQVSLV